MFDGVMWREYTPTLYRLMASQLSSLVPWAHVHVFWGDERYVPPEDPRSNFGMAKETLLDHVDCPAANVHRMPTQFADAGVAAREYERTLRSYFDEEWPDFDLVLLGLGGDGHTASLFPGSLALAEKTKWVVATTVPADPPLRLTLTLPALVGAAAIYVLVAGTNKALALQHDSKASAIGSGIRQPGSEWDPKRSSGGWIAKPQDWRARRPVMMCARSFELRGSSYA